MSAILKRVGNGLLLVVNYLQLEASLPHVWHIVIVCVSIFLSYLLGAVNTPEPANQVKV